jgi:hypothetical protein
MEKLKFADGSSGSTNAITEHHFRNIAEKKAVKNKDGSLSTVKTRIVEIDGVETLIPTIWDGKERSIQESIKRAKESGKNYPKALPTKEGREALQKLDNAIHVEMKPISAEKAKEILENRFDPQGEGYDFETADKFNIKPDKSGHYQSRVPETGMILKGKNHPTFHKTVKADEELGYRIVQGTDGRYYSFKKPLARAEGGAIMENQMEMAFMQEGGMQDDGGKVEPTSGNEVPSGSLEDEVKDDIPAMLSEGEFVFPADVVRFIGLSNLMKMRQDAKQGLKMMEKMGQLGNPDEAEIPDDVPFEMADLVVVTGEMKEEDKEEKAEGGVVGLQTGGLLNDPRFTSQTTAGTQPTEYTEEEKQEIKDALEGTPTRGQVTLKKIVNPDNPEDFEMHPYDGDEPMFPLPEGYVLDDTPTEQQLDTRPSGRVTTGTDSGDTGGGSQTGRFTEPVIDPFTGQPEARPTVEMSQDTDMLAKNINPQTNKPYGKEFALFNKDGVPIRLQESTFNNLVKEYEDLKNVENAKITFQQYYNLPTYDKVRFALKNRLGSEPSAEQIKKAINASQEGGTGLAGILSPLTGVIKSFFSSKAAEKGKIDPESAYVQRREKVADAGKTLKELEDLASPKSAERNKPLSMEQLQKYTDARSIQAQSPLPTAFKGVTDPMDKALRGIRTGKDKKTGKDIPIVRSVDPRTGKLDPNAQVTPAIMDRIIKNEQQVAQRTRDAYSDPSLSIAERERLIHGVPTASEDFWSGPAGGGSNEPGSGGATSGFGFRSNKGGMAKPKAKPKRMKKGGLASKKKK